MEEKHINITFTPKTILWVIVTALAVWFTFAIKDILISLLLAFIFAASIDPIVDYFEKRKIPRVASIAGLYLILIGFILLLASLIVPPAVAQISEISLHKARYIDQISSYFRTLDPALKETIKNSILNSFSTFGQTAAGGILSGAFTVLSGFVSFTIILVISFYLLIQKDGPEKFISVYIPSNYSTKAITVARKITAKMGSWFRGQLFLSFVIFLITFIGLSILRVDYALTLALIAGFMEIIPVIGPFIAGAVASLVALASSPLLALIVVIFFFLVQQLENNILVPQIMKKSLGLNPVVIIVSLLIGAKILGVIGALIAVPIAAALSVVANEFIINKGGK